MITLSLSKARETNNNLKNRFGALVENIEEQSSINDDDETRDICSLRVIFCKEALEEKTGVDEFDIIEAYFDAITNEFMARAMSDTDTAALNVFLKSL